jgi:hypothetical protein
MDTNFIFNIWCNNIGYTSSGAITIKLMNEWDTSNTLQI